MEFIVNELKVFAFVIDNKLSYNNMFSMYNTSQIGKEFGLNSHFIKKAIKQLVEKGIITSEVEKSSRTTFVKTANKQGLA